MTGKENYRRAIEFKGPAYLLCRIGANPDWLYDRDARVFERVRSGGAHVWMHLSRNVTAILPDLIEIGLNILNPVQPHAMDVRLFSRKFGGKVCSTDRSTVYRRYSISGRNSQRAVSGGSIRLVQAARSSASLRFSLILRVTCSGSQSASSSLMSSVRICSHEGSAARSQSSSGSSFRLKSWGGSPW